MATVCDLFFLYIFTLILLVQARLNPESNDHDALMASYNNKLVAKHYTFSESNSTINKSSTSNSLQAPTPSPTVDLIHKHKGKKNSAILWILLFSVGALAVISICGTITLISICGTITLRKNEFSPAIFSSLIEPEDLEFLGKDGVASLQIIGKGGCGEVYKAELHKSRVDAIAIKKVKETPKNAPELIEEDTKLFTNKMRQIVSEIVTVGQIRHRNLLPLLAHVSWSSFHYLVYEYMKNGSLQDILQQVKDGNKELDWLARHRIALGVATGIEFLHLSHTPHIAHRDLKPANILLDDDMEALIADFGLAKSFSDADTQVRGNTVAGTLGYIAPEYYHTMEFTDKCDIYSFGVLLAVLVTGKFPSDEFFRTTYEMGLVVWIKNVLTSDEPKQAIEPKLMGNGYEEHMLLVLNIACFCTRDDPKERPNSEDVRLMLALINH